MTEITQAELDQWLDYFRKQVTFYSGAVFDARIEMARLMPRMFCPNCRTFDCAAIKNSAAMCPGPAP